MTLRNVCNISLFSVMGVHFLTNSGSLGYSLRYPQNNLQITSIKLKMYLNKDVLPPKPVFDCVLE